MTTAPDPREPLGKIVREAGIAAAKELLSHDLDWLAGWDDLDPVQREVDMRIGEALAAHARVVTEDMVDRAFGVIAHESTLPFMASVGSYVSMGSEGAERAAEMSALKAADEECNELNRAFVRRMLEAALSHRGGR